jgi:hypothetical protein
VLRQTDDCIRRLEESAEDFRKKSEAPLPEYRSRFQGPSPTQLFLETELWQFMRQRIVLARSIFANLFTWLSITTMCFRKCFEAKISVSFDFDELDAFASRQFTSNAEYQQLNRRIVSVEASLAHSAPETKTATQLLQIGGRSLIAIAWHYNGQRDFSYSSVFDVHLYEYFVVIGIQFLDFAAQALSPHLPPIDDFGLKSGNATFSIRPIVKRRPASYRPGRIPLVKPPDFGPLQQLYTHIVEAFNADTPEKQGVVRCSLLRVVADRLYLLDPLLNTPNNSIQEGLDMIRQLRVEEMNLPTRIFESSRVDRICDLPHTNQVIGEVASFLEITQFSCSPFDIAESISTVSSIINGITRSGQGHDAMEVCFDDFFAVFAVVFAASPLINACGIAELFAVFGFLEYPGALKHAVTAFCAWVEFVEEFPKQQRAAEAPP